MPLQKLQFKAELKGITSVAPLCSDRWKLRIRCSSCQEENKNPIWLDRSEELKAIPGSRGEAHVIVKCKLCAKIANLTMLQDIKSVPRIKGSFAVADGEPSEWQTLAVVECRGCTVVSWALQGMEWVAKNENTEFDPTELDDDFYDFDEKTDNEVSITEIRTRVK
jgi:hypothetical protein